MERQEVLQVLHRDFRAAKQRLDAATKKFDAVIREAPTGLSLSDGLQADLEQFAHSASHDLREPIRSISVYSELFTKHYERFLDQEGKEFLSLIHSGAQRMETLLADLLSYAHASSISDEAPEPIRFQTVAGTDKSKIRATMN